MIRCPWCSMKQHRHDSLLGRLGNLIHYYRCRFCDGVLCRGVR